MMRFTQKLVMAVLALAGIFACQKIEEPTLTQPAGYPAVCQAYRNGERFVKAEFSNLTTILSFESTVVSLTNSSFSIMDCSNCSVPNIGFSTSTNTYKVNGVDTGIPKTEGRTLEESYPIQGYVRDNTLYIWVSNGEIMEFETYVDPDKYKQDWVGKPGEPQKYTMPRLYINHSADRVHSSYYVDATIKIEDPDAHYSETKTLTSNMQIKGHGNSTWGMPKKPYRIKLSEEQRVLGMPKNRDWVLLANYADKSLLRNSTAMKMSQMVGMDWTPRFRNVELYFNGSYEGVYNIFEAKEVTKNKVNIDIDAGDLYLEIEQNVDEPHSFTTKKCGVPIQFKEPEEPTSAQIKEVEKLFNDFETALYSSNFTNPDVGYAKYIDVDSFINYYIVEEIAKDIDGNIRKSTFLTYDAKTKKVKFYNFWDFDLCFGNTDYFPSGQTGCEGDPNGPKGWWIKDYNTDSWKGPSWYNRLFLDKNFVKKVQERWDEMYPSFEYIPEWIDYWVAEMGDAPTRNFKKWNILNTYVWPNVKITGSYSGEVKWLKDFYVARLKWLDENIDKL